MSGGVRDEASAPRTGLHRLGRNVFDVDWLHLILPVPVDGEEREAPDRPGDVAEQQVALSEQQRGPDDRVSDSQAHQLVLHLGFGPEVGQSERRRGVGHGEVDYPLDSRPPSSLEHRSGALGGAIEGNPAPCKPYPVGVEEDARALHRAA